MPLRHATLSNLTATLFATALAACGGTSHNPPSAEGAGGSGAASNSGGSASGLGGATGAAGSSGSAGTSGSGGTETGPCSPPERIDGDVAGLSTSPVLGFASGGDGIATWLEAGGGADQIWMRPLVAGTWSTPAQLQGQPPGAVRRMQVVIGGAGAFAAWDQSDENDTILSGLVAGSDTQLSNWSPPHQLHFGQETIASFNSTVGVDAMGNAVAAWQTSDPPPSRVWMSQFEASTATWGEPEELTTDPTVDAFGPFLAVNSLGAAVLAWHQLTTTEPRTVNAWVAFRDGGIWLPPMELVSGASQLTALSMNDAGDVILAWQQQSPAGLLEPWAIRYDGSTALWGQSEQLDATPGFAQALQVVIAEDGDALAVWDLLDTDTVGHGAWASFYDAQSDTWQPSEQIESLRVAGSPQGLMNDTGAAVTLLVDADAGKREIWHYRRGPTADRWPPPIVLPSLSPQSFWTARAPDGADWIVWAEAEGGEARIWATRCE